MRAYSQEVAGRKHVMCEDSHYKSIITDKSGSEIGIFIIGDGLSGYDGLAASHLAVKSVGENVSSNILFRGYENGVEIVTSAIIEVNEMLSALPKETRTTLDVLVAKRDAKPIIAHVGDGRIYSIGQNGVVQLTEDESDGASGPSNYLGKKFILSKPIDQRINFVDVDIPVRGYFLTSDGLRSRVNEKYVHDALIGGFVHPQRLLDTLSSEVYVPKSKIEELRTSRLDALCNQAGLSVTDSESSLMRIVSAYRYQHSREMINIIDTMFPFDDTTMIFVDLQDEVNLNLDFLDTTRRVDLPQRQSAFQRLQDLYNNLQEQYNALQSQFQVAEQMVRDKDSAVLRYERNIIDLSERIDALQHEQQVQAGARSNLAHALEVATQENHDAYKVFSGKISHFAQKLIGVGCVKAQSVLGRVGAWVKNDE